MYKRSIYSTVIIIFVSCIFVFTPSDIGAIQHHRYDEAHVRLIMLDITLGGTYDYFSGHRDEIDPHEALKRWDAGVRVLNAERFERKTIQGNWHHTYKGTDIDVDGMDVLLSTDQQPRSSFDEAHVRLIILDITLGGTYAYFNVHTDEPDPREAIRRWDAGVRVLNAERFERKTIRGNWHHTYKGTNTDVDGMLVRLTTD